MKKTVGQWIAGGIFLCLSCFAIRCLGSVAVAASPPNIVLIVADDLGWGDVGYHGSEIVTPAIDGLVAEGVELDRFYAYPVCSPTRVGLLTGCSPARFGIIRPLSPKNDGLDTNKLLLSNLLRDAGYQTWLVGKWHIGAKDTAHRPRARGFKHFYGFLHGGIDYYKHTEFRDSIADWYRNEKPVEEEGYSTDLFAKEATSLIRNRDASTPFFLLLSFNAPHTPLQAPEKIVSRYASIEDESRRTYAAMVTALDSAIADVLNTLADCKLRENTLVVFVSDNGGSTKSGASNGSLRDGKGSVYEGGIRVPAAVSFPGVLPVGIKCEQRVTVLDLFSTVCEVAQVSIPETLPQDGRSVWPALRDEAVVADKAFCVTTERQAAVLRDDWKLVVPQRGQRQDRAPQLYRISTDENESEDIAEDFPVVVEQLSNLVEKITVAPTNGRRGR